ncbi:MerR family transcriptional regulator [Sporosarcina sp. FSL K6-6792]|uniref:MerR family transcriptional regulator n=1 Tax=Sporosarcina sp. FSL K6-6792 TaxID=2921559 RepID=UPI0030FB9F7C
MGKDKLRIGELADIAGVSKRTIDYYTNLNLLKPSRSDTGYRLFDLSDVVQLDKISHLKEKGFSLEEINEKLAFPDTSELVLEKALLVKSNLQELLVLLKRAERENSSIKESITHDTLPVIQALLQLLV